MPIKIKRKNGEVTRYINAEYIPLFYFLPKSLLDKCGNLPFQVSRFPYDLFHDWKQIDLIESDQFNLLIKDAFHYLVWPYMGLKAGREIYSGYYPAWNFSHMPSYWIKALYDADVYFPDMDVRFIAANDNIDSDEGESEIAPFKNIINEWYARDISKKVKSSYRIRGNLGEPLAPPPYGYIKSPENPKKWIVDPEAAKVVKDIFRIQDCRERLAKIGEMKQNKDDFIRAVRKFMEMETLTAPMLRELIDHIDVYEKTGGKKNYTQQIVIYYRFVGFIEIPRTSEDENYKADTRTGVEVEYIPAKSA